MTNYMPSPLCLHYHYNHIIFLSLLVIFVSWTSFPIIVSASPKTCTIFSFGDSNSDVGSGAAASGFDVEPPNGQSFFSGSTGRRACDGRLYIDFLCEKLNMSFLSPYLESSGADLHQGASFAVGGSCANDIGFYPFGVQVQQFFHLQKRTQDLRPQGKGSMLSDKDFRNAVYMVDIGHNDLWYAFDDGSSLAVVVKEKIPVYVDKIRSGIEKLYKLGGRKFLVINVGPLGCLPAALGVARRIPKLYHVDEAGCAATIYNDAAKQMNDELRKLSANLTMELKGSILVYTDMYGIKYDIIANATKLGFDDPLMACLGPNSSICPIPSRRISWDGVHFTQAANDIVANKIFSGKHATPNLNLLELCKAAIE